MNWTPSFTRKVIYLCIIGVLLLSLPFVGLPTSISGGGSDSGGYQSILAGLRQKHELAPGSLGEIDPASETMKLATLGLRGVAANMLWSRALEHKKRREFDDLTATVNQITKLQPHFVAVWDFQAHNLSYNISVEFDDYRQRYHWVKKGISFLISGTEYNRGNTKLLSLVGWYISQKMGRSDEQKQFRRMFREDTDFQETMSAYVDVDAAEKDSWLMGRLWYKKAETAVENGARIEGRSPLLFYSQAPMARINHADALYEDYRPDETAMLAWGQASRDWRAYGSEDILTSWGVFLKLNELEKERSKLTELEKELHKTAPGAREKLLAERVAELSEEERQLYEKPEDEIAADEYFPLATVKAKVEPAPLEIAAFAKDQAKALNIAEQIGRQLVAIHRITSYRQQVNFDYWRARCQAESQQVTLRARQYAYDAAEARKEARLTEAIELYEKSFAEWDKVFFEYPVLLDGQTVEELIEDIDVYRRTLDQVDESFPEDFILTDVLKFNENSSPVTKYHRGKQPASETPDGKPSDDKPKDDKPADDKPKDDKPSDDKPSDDKPKDDKPADDKPAAKSSAGSAGDVPPEPK